MKKKYSAGKRERESLLIIKNRKMNVCSLILNLFLAISTFFCTSYSVLVKIGTGNMAGGYKALRYFTHLSNIYAAVCAVVMVFFCVKNIINDEYYFPKWALVLKHTGTVAISVTFITVVFFLAPYASALGMGFLFLFEENCFFVHLINPIAAIVSYLWFERGGDIKLKDSLFGIIPTILYSIVYFIMVVFIGEENGGWPDFYGFTFGGRMYLVPVVIMGMYLATFAISTIELHIRRKIGEK